jgi:hypothetical protein
LKSNTSSYLLLIGQNYRLLAHLGAEVDTYVYFESRLICLTCPQTDPVNLHRYRCLLKGRIAGLRFAVTCATSAAFCGPVVSFLLLRHYLAPNLVLRRIPRSHFELCHRR